MHVFGSLGHYPYSPHRKYTPGEASFKALQVHLRSLALERVVIVQPSPYGTDNACTLEALRELKDMARAVVVIDDLLDKNGLFDLHVAGVRGVRVNLETEGERNPDAAQRRLWETAIRVAVWPRWHVQTFARIEVLKGLRVDTFPMPLVIDHFGLASSADELLPLMKHGNVYVKLSAPHRLKVDAKPLVQALAAAHPDRLLWGSDWPHPALHRSGKPFEIEPFDAIDDAAALKRLSEWVPANVLEKILVENPARLYDF